MSTQLLTPKEAAAFLRSTVGTLANSRWQGKGPEYIRISKNKILYDADDLKKYLDQRKVKIFEE